MGDASGMYTSPTGTRPQNGGAGQGQGNNEGFNNASFQLDDGDQHLESAGGRRTSIGTMATLAGGAGTPSPAQQEPQAQPMDPLVQSLMSSVRLLATMWMTPSSTLSSRCDLPMGESRPGKQDKSISCLGGLCANSLGSESLYCTD